MFIMTLLLGYSHSLCLMYQCMCVNMSSPCVGCFESILLYFQAISVSLTLVTLLLTPTCTHSCTVWVLGSVLCLRLLASPLTLLLPTWRRTRSCHLIHRPPCPQRLLSHLCQLPTISPPLSPLLLQQITRLSLIQVCCTLLILLVE